MNCQFKTITPNHHKCDICGFEIVINEDSNKIYRACEKIEQDKIPNVQQNQQNQQQEFPPLLEQAKNFFGSMVDYALDGFQNVSDEEHRGRLDICNKCEFFVNGGCSKCGCVCSWKTWPKGAKCPVGKW